MRQALSNCSQKLHLLLLLVGFHFSIIIFLFSYTTEWRQSLLTFPFSMNDFYNRVVD
jgi:hypothetical protein